MGQTLGYHVKNYIVIHTIHFIPMISHEIHEIEQFCSTFKTHLKYSLAYDHSNSKTKPQVYVETSKSKFTNDGV